MDKKGKASLALLLALALAACGGAPAGSDAASPAPESPVQESPAPAAPAGEPAPAPTPDPFGAAYTLTAAEPTLSACYGGDAVPLPDKAVPLYLSSDTALTSWAEAAELSGCPEDTLRALNPGVREQDGKLQMEMDGYTYGVYDLLMEREYALPHTPCLQVEIDLPDTATDGGAFLVPAALEERAAITLAEGLGFLYHVSPGPGYGPSEAVEGRQEEGLFRTLPGARFTAWADFKAYLDGLLTPELEAKFLEEQENDWGYTFPPCFQEGDNGELWFTVGDRGVVHGYLGMTYTEPQAQPDGSLTFGLLSLTADEHVEAWLQGEMSGAEALDRADYLPVRLTPDGAGGWRVAALRVPN